MITLYLNFRNQSLINNHILFKLDKVQHFGLLQLHKEIIGLLLNQQEKLVQLLPLDFLIIIIHNYYH